MGRPLRVIQNIYPYHLVCRTNNRSFRFDKRSVTRIVFQALKETIEKYNLLVHHLVLMSNHYHIIATATEEQSAVTESINRNVVEITEIADATAVEASTNAESCVVMTKNVEALVEMLGQFKIGRTA